MRLTDLLQRVKKGIISITILEPFKMTLIFEHFLLARKKSVQSSMGRNFFIKETIRKTLNRKPSLNILQLSQSRINLKMNIAKDILVPLLEDMLKIFQIIHEVGHRVAN